MIKPIIEESSNFHIYVTGMNMNQDSTNETLLLFACLRVKKTVISFSLAAWKYSHCKKIWN